MIWYDRVTVVEGVCGSGVDVGSAVAIHEALVRLRDEGAAIVLISEDLDELYQLCNRLGALCADSPGCPAHRLI